MSSINFSFIWRLETEISRRNGYFISRVPSKHSFNAGFFPSIHSQFIYSSIEIVTAELTKTKHLLQKDIINAQDELVDLKNKKQEYVNLYTNNVISKEELSEYRELTDNKLKAIQLTQAQLEEKLQECESENYAVHIGKKLKDVLTLKELTPKILHSLVEKITCSQDGTVNIQYSFVNPMHLQ